MFETMHMRLQESASAMLETVTQRFVDTAPQLILALLILFFGMIIARYARKIFLHLADLVGLDKLANKVNVDRSLKMVGLNGSISKVLGLLVYWLIILISFLLASELLNLDAISDAIGEIVGYIPHLIAALVIVVIGLLIGRFLRDVVSTSLARAGVNAGVFLGYAVQIIILLFMCILALDQLGIDVSFITTHMVMIMGVSLITIGFAIAIAIRPLLESMLICQQVKQHLRKGDYIDLDGLHGEVVGFSLTSIVVRHGEKDIVVPSRQFFDQRFTRARSS